MGGPCYHFLLMKNIRFVPIFLALLACQAPNAAAEPTQSSLSKLILSGKTLACSYEKTDENGTQKGTVYIAQNRMRGDFDVTTKNEGTFPMHMIHEGEWTYTWGGPMGETQGMKMKTPPPGANRGPGQGPDMDEDMKMDCKSWPPDGDKFTPPAGVEFHELGGMMGSTGPDGVDMKALQCGACDQAPPESQEQCRQALGCA